MSIMRNSGWKCEDCGGIYNNLDEICFYDVNGNSVNTHEEIDINMMNPDSLAYLLCGVCADERFK